MRIGYFKELTAAFLLFITGFPAQAAGGATGTINNVTVQIGITFFNVTGGHNNNPACGTTNRWAFKGSTAEGQVMMATILTAYALGKTVVISGTGDCSVWGDAETVSYVVSQ